MPGVKHLTTEELEAGLDEIRRAPADEGVLKMIVRRPATDRREMLQTGRLDPREGLVGDCWKGPGEASASGKAPKPDTQLTIVNARAIAHIAQQKDRWPLAGDQLYLDMDLSAENLPPGTQLELGSAVIEITAIPHNGCHKFVARFGEDARSFVNSPIGKQLHLRGIYAKVIQPGTIQVGDAAKKIQPESSVSSG